MERIYIVLREIENGTKSANGIFSKVGTLFNNNLLELQKLLDDLQANVYIRFQGGNSLPTYEDMILTDKGRDYKKRLKPRYGIKDFIGPCNNYGKIKCKEHFLTNIEDLCNTCFWRTKIEGIRANMIMKFETLKSINTREYIIEHLKKEIKKGNKKIANMLNIENQGWVEFRENRVGLYLSYKDCVKYYTEQLTIIESEDANVPVSMEIIKSDIDKVKNVPDVEFIQGTINESFQTRVNPGNNTVEHSFVITKNGEKRKYTPYKYLDLILECYFITIDKEDDINLKISAVVNAKVTINRRIREHGLSRFKYDFSNIFAEIEDTMYQLKSYKELGITSKKQNEVKTETTPQIETKQVVQLTINDIQNNFDNIPIKDVFTHFYNGLVVPKYITESELLQYLNCAFDKKEIPTDLFKFINILTKQAIMKVFYEYYKNVASKPHGKQRNYASLLGDYFQGYNTDSVSTNFNK